MILVALSVELSFNCGFFLNTFPVCFNFFVLLFLVTPCLVVAVQPSMARILIKKKKKKILTVVKSWDPFSPKGRGPKISIIKIGSHQSGQSILT